MSSAKDGRVEAALAAALLVLGAGGQVAQAVLAREWLLVFHGNELSLGLALASWLLWVGIGSLLAARGRRGSADTLKRVGLGIAGLAVLMPLTVVWLRRVRGGLGLVPGEMVALDRAVALASLPMAPVCLLWGALFVWLARLGSAQEPKDDIAGGARAYAWEALGTFAGGLLFSLVLVHFVDSLAAGVVAVAALAAAAAVLAPSRSRLRVGLAVGAGCGVLLIPAGNRLERWTQAVFWKNLLPDGELLAVHRSRYGPIAVLRRGEQYSFFQSGQLVFAAGAAGSSVAALEEQAAAALAHLALAQHPQPRRVLLVGGGLRGVLRELLTQPLEALDYVEMDPALLSAARPVAPAETLQALADPRVRLVVGDGRMAVKAARERYDLVIVDVPDPSTAALNRFYTREFFREVRRALRPDGVLALSVASTAGMRDPHVLNRNVAIFHTLRGEFAHVFAAGDRELLFFAANESGILSAEPDRLQARHRLRPVRSRVFSDGLFFTLLEEGTLRRINWLLRHHGRQDADLFAVACGGPLFPPPLAEQEAEEARHPAPPAPYFLNSDFRPIAYLHTLLFWSRQVHGRASPVLAALWRVRAEWLLGPLALAVIAVAVGRRHPRARRYALRYAVGATGGSTMALQLVLLFAFQSQYGFVYEMIGLIVALFMAGLAAGAAGYRGARMWARFSALHLGMALWAALLALALPLAARWAGGAGLFVFYSLLTFGSGLWNGIHFPLALGAVRQAGGSAGGGIGLCYGLELVGACLGALLAGLMLVPILGLVRSCLLAAALHFSVFAVLCLTRPRAGGDRGGAAPA